MYAKKNHLYNNHDNFLNRKNTIVIITSLIMIFAGLSYNSRNNCIQVALLLIVKQLLIFMYIVFKPVFLSSMGRTSRYTC